MTQILETYQTPDFEKTSMGFINTAIHPNCQTITEKLTKVITKLERQDIAWIDILTAMANIAAEQGGEEQIAQRLESTALLLKRNRRFSRDL